MYLLGKDAIGTLRSLVTKNLKQHVVWAIHALFREYRRTALSLTLCTRAIHAMQLYCMHSSLIASYTMSNMLTRILVALVGIPLMVWICLEGGWIFSLLVALLCAQGLREFYALSISKAAQPQVPLGTVMAALVPLLVHLRAMPGGTDLLLPFALAGILILMTLELWRKKPHPFLNISVQLSGFLYVVLLLSSLVLVRDFSAESGLLLSSGMSLRSGWQGYLILCSFIGVWSGDSFAYFAGLAFGKHKIFPRVSPKKSWEGSIAGFFGSILAFHLASHFMLPELPMWHGFALGAVIGIVGPIGDFVESLMKRDAAIKDSGSLIPGHGGVLDRFDSLLFVAPIIYIYLKLVLSAGNA